MSDKKSTPRNNFLFISTSILASLVIIILVLAVMVGRKAWSGNRLAGSTASPTSPALVQETPTNPSSAPAKPSATAPAVPGATTTPLPSVPPSPLPVTTSTYTPTTTPTSISTPTSAPIAQVSPGSNAYCRKGPGNYYDVVTYLQAGSSYQVVGRDGQDTWWQIQYTLEVRCWMGDPNSTLEGPVKLAPLVPAPPLPSAASSFTTKSHCDPVLNTMTVWLTWGAASGATGYRIYRNDEVIAELGVGTTSYTELAPRFVNLIYRLEAFNEYGFSPDRSLMIKACL